MGSVRVLPFHKFHGKEQTGSYRLRFGNLMKYWPDLADYKYGEHADVMIYQKVYWLADWRLMEHRAGLQILDISDPDWLDWMNVKATVDAVHAITCPTETLATFIRQLTDKPIIVIPDRHDISKAPRLKRHTGTAKNLVWFGYSHNSQALNQCMPFLERSNYHLTVISNQDPSRGFLAADPAKIHDKYTFVQYDDAKKFEELARADIFLNPAGTRAVDRFKSNNRTTTAWLAGLPVATTADEIEAFASAESRNKEAKKNYDLARKDYDSKLSVNQYKQLILTLYDNAAGFF